MRKIVIFIFVNYLFQASLSAQIPGFTQFNNNNGLPSNTVYDINQDENGLIWIATDYGLSRFDGLTFKNFTISDGLPDNEVLYLFKDSKKRIWLVGFNGKLGYLQNNKFYNSQNQKFLRGLNFNNFVSDIFEDSKNNIWFLQAVNNIKKLDPHNTITTYNNLELPYKNNSNKAQIVEDTNEEIKVLVSSSQKNNINQIQSSSLTKNNWRNIDANLYTKNTLQKLRRKKAEAFKNIDKKTMLISNTIFNSFNYNRSTNYLYQTLPFDNSFLITNLSKGALIINSLDKTKNKKILPSIHSSKSFLDREKNIWVGSLSNGLFLLPNLNINGIRFDNEKRNDLHSINLFNKYIALGNDQSELILLNQKTLQIINSYKVDLNPKRVRQLNIKNNFLYILSDYNVHQLNKNLKFELIKNMYESNFKNLNIQNFKDISIEKDFIVTANAGGISKINK
ncbi:MAG: hypothetical protein GQ540_12940, partial [Lutibacter sp.]|uniref:two-component regulator propeller domain-containing protein n=1 Tax=Lutibacter sp. TaxID=1925666 RepID=UPI0019EF8943